MSAILHNAPDVTTFAANVVVFLAAVAAAVVGAMSAVKAIKKSVLDMTGTEGVVTKTQIIGGVLQEGFSSPQLIKAIDENTFASLELRNVLGQVRDDLRENRHTMDRLNDAIRSNISGR